MHNFLHLDKQGVQGSILLAVSAIASLVSPWCLVKVVDEGIEQQDFTVMIIWISASVVSLAASGILRYAGRCLITQKALQLEKDRLVQLFHKALNADIRDIPELGRGEALGQILFAASSERQFFEMLYAEGVNLLIISLGTFAALLTLSSSLTLISLALFPFFIFFLFWLKNKIRPAVREEFTARERIYHQIVASFETLIPIRAAHCGHKFEDLLTSTADQCVKAGYSLIRKSAIQGPVFDILQALFLAAVFGFGGYYIIEGSLTLGILIGFQLYLTRLFSVMKSGASIFSGWQEFLEGCSRSDHINQMRTAPEIQMKKASEPNLLELHDVTFSFGDHIIWQHKDLTLERGEYQAILLPSGGGKTTLARCILGLYPIDEGAIAIPEGDVKKIGFVPQENALFDISLRENIELISGPITDSDYEKLLFICGLQDIAERMKDQTAGECGSLLSGGEQRRIMLARALATKPALLLIDQMSSELEPELCRHIFTQIRENNPALGILYFGHRMPEW